MVRGMNDLRQYDNVTASKAELYPNCHVRAN
jgi:hypothetical protein